MTFRVLGGALLGCLCAGVQGTEFWELGTLTEWGRGSGGGQSKAAGPTATFSLRVCRGASFVLCYAKNFLCASWCFDPAKNGGVGGGTTGL